MLFMDINKLIAIVKKKLQDQILIEDILIEDKTFLHKKHPGNQKDKFHIKITIKSTELKKMVNIKHQLKKIIAENLECFALSM